MIYMENIKLQVSIFVKFFLYITEVKTHTMFRKGVREMLLLKIVYEGELIVVEELQQLKQYFKKKNITLGISESIEGTTHFIKVLCDNEIYDDKK